jgi:hypothetical protein
MTVDRNQIGWTFGVLWILMTAIGWVFGLSFGAFFAVVIICNPVFRSCAQDVDILVLFMLGVGPGFVVGVIQWVFLRMEIPLSGLWILASASGLVIAIVSVTVTPLGGLKGGLDVLLTPGLVVALGGAVAGILQWVILREHVSQAAWWVPASTIGWGLSMVMWLAFSFSGVNPLHALVLGGFLHGVVTGGALIWLLRQPVPESKLEVESP